MFDSVRKHTKILMIVLFLLIIPSFVLFGIDGYTRMKQSDTVVARVADVEITQAQWDAAHRQDVDQLRAAQPNLDAKLLDTPAARYASLERLVREKVLEVAAKQMRMVTTDARLARFYLEDPAMASLRKPDGTLDIEGARAVAASRGMSLEGLDAMLRQDITLNQVQAAALLAGFAPPAVADRALNAFFEQRRIRVYNFMATDFAAKVSPTDADLQAFYTAHSADFQAPEQADVEYVVLDLEAVKQSISISDADLRSYYDQNVTRLSGVEERRASHILITAAKDAPADQRQKAKARAQELLTALRAKPDLFDELAKKNSQDPGSAAKGGDLGFFGRGAMVKPFEDAAFGMKKGDISDIVESDFGYHIIRLTDVKVPPQRSFDELKPTLLADLKTQQAQRKFAELAEIFTNTVYEQSDSLKAVADRLKLQVQTVKDLRRDPQPGTKGTLGSAKFLAALFSPDAIDQKRNTEAIEVGPNELAAGRVVAHRPAHALTLDEVRSTVRERWIAERALALAQAEGKAKLAAWQADPASAPQGAEVLVSRDQPNNIPMPVVLAALRTPAAKLPAWTGLDVGRQGYAVVRVDAVVAREASARPSAQKDREQFAQWLGQAESQAYYESLKQRLGVSIQVPKPAPESGAVAR
ncbi:MAG: SurA N-terminal domain-containing protein [Rhodoferax sp.]